MEEFDVVVGDGPRPRGLAGLRAVAVSFAVALVVGAAACTGAGSDAPADGEPVASAPPTATAGPRGEGVDATDGASSASRPAGPPQLSAAVIDVTEVPTALGQEVALSPDGRVLLALQGVRLCAYDVGEFAEERSCTLWDRSLAALGVAWSPDGDVAALAEASPAEGRDSPVWLFSTREGRARTLLEDGGGAGGAATGSAQEPQVDVAPAFSPDGSEVAFLRGGADGVEVLAAPVEGGDVRTLATLPFVPGGALRWVGERVLLTGAPEGEADDALWSVPATGGEPVRAADVPPGRGALRLVDAAGDRALLLYPELVVASRGGTSHVDVVDLRDGSVEPVLPAGEEDLRFVGPTTAGLAPDGASVAFTYLAIPDSDRLPEAPIPLAVRDLDGDDGSAQPLVDDLRLAVARLGADGADLRPAFLASGASATSLVWGDDALTIPLFPADRGLLRVRLR